MKSIHCTVGENNINAPKFHISYRCGKPSRFGSVAAHPDLDGKILGQKWYCAGNNELD